MQAQPRAVDTGATSARMIELVIAWHWWPVVSGRFGCLLGVVKVPGEPEKWQPEVELSGSRTLKLIWDADGKRYIAPFGFPLGRLETFQQL